MLLCRVALSCDHAAHLIPESGKNDHCDVAENEQDKEIRHEKVNRSRRLVSAEHSNDERHRRRDGRRHRKSGHHHEWNEQKDHNEIGPALPRVVRRHVGREVTGGQPGKHIGRAVQHTNSRG